jgi:hypothetical protein
MQAHEIYRLDTNFFRKRSNQKGSIGELGGAGRMQKCTRMRAIASTQNFFENVRIRRAALRKWEELLGCRNARARDLSPRHKIFSNRFESEGQH